MTISQGLQNLRNLKTDHMDVGRMLAGDLFPMDFLAFAVLNRSLCLSFGFASLIEQRNFVAAAPLLRFQLDNALRFYASTLVKEPHQFSMAVLRGESIRDIKATSGNRLTDAYLLSSFIADTRLDIDRSWLRSVYDQTSGYVHLSEKHMFNCLKAGDAGTLQMKISEVDEYVPDGIYAEAIDAMIEATRLTIKIVFYWAHQKTHPPETVQ